MGGITPSLLVVRQLAPLLYADRPDCRRSPRAIGNRRGLIARHLQRLYDPRNERSVQPARSHHRPKRRNMVDAANNVMAMFGLVDCMPSPCPFSTPMSPRKKMHGHTDTTQRCCSPLRFGNTAATQNCGWPECVCVYTYIVPTPCGAPQDERRGGACLCDKGRATSIEAGPCGTPDRRLTPLKASARTTHNIKRPVALLEFSGSSSGGNPTQWFRGCGPLLTFGPRHECSSRFSGKGRSKQGRCCDTSRGPIPGNSKSLACCAKPER